MKPVSCNNLKGRLRYICEGSDENGHPIDMLPEKRLAYLKSIFPDRTIEDLVAHMQNQSSGVKKTGLGDIVAAGIKIATAGLVKPCIPCEKRKQWLNEINFRKVIPFLAPRPISNDTRRNLLMHLWPTGNGAWQWNLDQILSRKHVFTGQVVIGVAEGPGTASASEVAEYAAELNPKVFSVPNNPRIREGATFQKLLSSVQNDKDSITFFCHGKGARHGGAFGDKGSTIQDWTETMYRSCLDDVDRVVLHLKTAAMTGPFRRFGSFKTPGNHRWHYSGAFYWFRNADVFERNWQKMDMFFFAVESWPGLMFPAEQVSCLFHDNAGDLYLKSYWDSAVQAELKINI